MNTTLLAAYAIVAPLYSFFRRMRARSPGVAWLPGRVQQNPGTARRFFNSDEAAWRRATLCMRASVAVTLQPPASQFRVLRPTQPVPAAPVRRPALRVVRVLESGQATAHTGRLLMSGRMADVCAELERMAEHESAAPAARRSA